MVPVSPQHPDAPSKTDDDGGKNEREDAAAALTAVLTNLSEQFVSWDQAVRRTRPDAVHQLRVTCRSLRAALKAASPLLDSGRADELALRLRNLARVLGAARDAEITAELLPARVETLGQPIDGETVELLQRRADDEATTAAARAKQHLKTKEHLKLVTDVQAFARQPPFTEKVEGKSSRWLANRTVKRSLRKAARVAVDAPTADVPKEHAPTVDAPTGVASTEAASTAGADNRDRGEAILEHAHEVRKAVKQVRYVRSALKAAGVRPGKKRRRAAAEAKRYQQELGEVMDAVVLRTWLARAAQDLSGTAHGYSIGLLLGAETVRVNEGIGRCEQLIEELPHRLRGNQPPATD
ncbi:CHAD domain-containing protein [Arthrobacter subterraneus]|uniref:CHAD domain-containing protein n=1 Tax=Arthrobacter subterraneus TaxID=335973 RepID=A0A1G8LB69_9MICC|nr:CHAD domain-containing protein [Arthrobacter subterraneus]